MFALHAKGPRFDPEWVHLLHLHALHYVPPPRQLSLTCNAASCTSSSLCCSCAHAACSCCSWRCDASSSLRALLTAACTQWEHTQTMCVSSRLAGRQAWQASDGSLCHLGTPPLAAFCCQQPTSSCCGTTSLYVLRDNPPVLPKQPPSPGIS